jgi:hypothetical protein
MVILHRKRLTIFYSQPTKTHFGFHPTSRSLIQNLDFQVNAQVRLKKNTVPIHHRPIRDLNHGGMRGQLNADRDRNRLCARLLLTAGDTATALALLDHVSGQR